MKSHKQFISEAIGTKAFLAGELPLSQRKKRKVVQKVISKRKSNDLSLRDGASGISHSSASSPEVNSSNEIYIGGNYLVLFESCGNWYTWETLTQSGNLSTV